MRFVAALSSDRALRFVAAHLFFFPLHRDAREQAHSPALGEALSERALRFVAAHRRERALRFVAAHLFFRPNPQQP